MPLTTEVIFSGLTTLTINETNFYKILINQLIKLNFLFYISLLFHPILSLCTVCYAPEQKNTDFRLFTCLLGTNIFRICKIHLTFQEKFLSKWFKWIISKNLQARLVFRIRLSQANHFLEIKLSYLLGMLSTHKFKDRVKRSDWVVRWWSECFTVRQYSKLIIFISFS